MVEEPDAPTVLVIEDERALVELYVRWLEGDFEVRTATSGREGLEELDEDVDIVLLDRLMPGMGGDEVLAEMADQEVNPKVCMVTAVEPDFDVITMGFDDYLTKPVEREELLETVERLLSRTEYADLEQELYALIAKRSALQATKPIEKLESSEEYQTLERRIEALRQDIDDSLTDIEDDEFVAMVRDIDSEDANGSGAGSAGGTGGGAGGGAG